MTASERIEARLLREFGPGGFVPHGTDTQLAAEFDVSRELVRVCRGHLGIDIDHETLAERIRGHAIAFGFGEPRRIRREHVTRIAQLLGCSREYVRFVVRELGIRDYRPGRRHATRSRYNAGCRCERCTEAHRDYQRALRARGAAAA